MTRRQLPGDPPVALTLRRSARARRISLRVSQLDGRVTLTLPRGVPEAEALRFAEEKAGWIRGHLARRGADIAVTIGAAIPVEGVARPILAGPGRHARIDRAGRILAPEAACGRAVQALLKTLARDRLAAACDGYAAALGRPYARITLRDTRSRWGSCSAQGGLMFSWRLIMAPPEVLAYVAAHEVAHLAQMNHSPAFWAEVARLYGPYEAPRAWLRGPGNALHRYRFDSPAPPR